MLNNLRQKIAGLFGKSSLKFFNIGALEVYSPIDTETSITKGFNANTAVYSIVMKDAKKFASIPRYVYDARSTEEKSFDYTKIDGALTDLLNRPNEFEGQDAFFTRVRASYQVTGEAFIWLNRGDIEQYRDEQGNYNDELIDKLPVLEMYVLPSQFVTLNPDPQDPWSILGYFLYVGGQRIPFRKNDIIHWKTTNLNFDAVTRTHLRGLSPLTAGFKTLQQNNDATSAAVRMYQNDGAKGVLYNESLDAMSPVQQSDVKTIVNAKINNTDVKGAVATLQGKWGYLSLAGSVDMQLLEGKELSWKELCFLLEVPYEFFDSKTTFANKEQAQQGWVNNTIIPACKQLDGELNRMLLKAFGLDKLGFIACDYTDMKELQPDLGRMITALAGAFWLTPNEKREMMNEEPYEDEQFDEPWMPTGITPLSHVADQAQLDLMTQQLTNRGLNDTLSNRGTGNGKVPKKQSGK